ncbi:hypothetical protein QP904_06190 [Corynebacterium kefirresidentii]|uniref:hypothetical protein n=1 Tax=Corynebacterium sp. MSK185 TaxID=3377092 RepID=UPI00254F75D2|nr:hypothetical protein [Corynebacterium kefirresidentii]MDK8586062.1 hypothetical protein [Corynebacterium kefirresidentii]
MDILWDYVIPFLGAVLSPIVSIFIVRCSNKRRDWERLEQVRREDYASQRRAVSECIRKMREAETEIEDAGKTLKLYSQFFDRYRAYLENLDLEVTHPTVSECLKEWQNRIDDIRSALQERLYHCGEKGSPDQKTIDAIKNCPEDLQRSAKKHLHILYDYNQLDKRHRVKGQKVCPESRIFTD